MAAWHFVSLPISISEKIRKASLGKTRGWGSLRVNAKIRGSEWPTSIFPDSKSGTYILPLKKEVRAAAGVRAGDKISLELSLLPPDGA